MSLSGANCSSNYLSVYDTYRNPQQRDQQQPNIKQQFKGQATEFIFRGELLDETEASSDPNQKKTSQSVDPANINAITQYEQTSSVNQPRQASGRILDAYI